MSRGQGTRCRWHHGHRAWGPPFPTPFFPGGHREELSASPQGASPRREGNGAGKKKGRDVLPGTPGTRELAPTQAELAKAERGGGEREREGGRVKEGEREGEGGEGEREGEGGERERERASAREGGEGEGGNGKREIENCV